MAEKDDENFEYLLKLAAMFERHTDQDNRAVSWEEMKAEIEALSDSEREMLLGLVKTMKKANESKPNSSNLDSSQ